MNEKNAFDAWLKSIDLEKACVLATILQTSDVKNLHSEALFIGKDKVLIGSLGNAYLEKQVYQIAEKKLAEKNPQSETKNLKLANQQEAAVFIDVFKPQPKIIIFGAGHDAIPVVQFIAATGFKTTMVDQRPLYNTEERFPDAERIIARAEAFAEKVLIDDNTFVIIMNHHMERDQEALAFALNSDTPYIGVLGPLSRRNRMMDTIKAEGRDIPPEDFKRIYNPIGLDIGARTSEEIAISITAEIIAMKNGYAGGFLKDAKFIHHAAESRTEEV